MDPVTIQSFMSEIDKLALLERVVRLAATDIPKTPRLLMKKRSPEDLKALQSAVEQGWNKRVTDPLLKKIEPAIGKLPSKVQNVARTGAKIVAEDPIGTLATNLIPIPGAHPAYLAGKKGLERAIDRFAPLR